jgi:hypothetical protein
MEKRFTLVELAWEGDAVPQALSRELQESYGDEESCMVFGLAHAW